MSTLDFSIADISDGVVEILASNGDVYCGGSDLDKIVAQYIVDEFKSTEGFDLNNDSMAMSRVMEAAEKAKMELSNMSSTDINLPYITAIDGIPKHLTLTLTKAKFEQLIDGEINKVIKLGKEAVKKANINTNELDGILLVGGSTRIPKLQDELTKEFNRPLLKNVNVDEVVAMGAAVQGAIISGEKTDVLLLDVTPLNLGIATMGDIMTPVIDANTTIPCKRSQIFTTAVDNQPAVTLQVVQGNRPMVKDNKTIGMFNLDGIAPAPRGVPKIEVTFDIDSNGILSVTAKDEATGKEQHITIESRGGLSSEDIERMKQEAEQYAEEDKKAKAEIELLNEADSYCFNIEKSMKDFGEKLTDNLKEPVVSAIETLKTAITEKDIEKVKELRQSLENVWNPIAESMYKSEMPEGEVNPDMAKTIEEAFKKGENPFAGGDFGTKNPFSK